MRRCPLLGAAAFLALVLGVTACGGSEKAKSAGDLKKALSEEIQSGDEGLDKETADCVADIIVDEVGVEALGDVDLSADEPPADLADDFTAAGARAAEECDLSGANG